MFINQPNQRNVLAIISYQGPANLLPPPFGALLSASPSAGLQTYTRPPLHHNTQIRSSYFITSPTRHPGGQSEAEATPKTEPLLRTAGRVSC